MRLKRNKNTKKYKQKGIMINFNIFMMIWNSINKNQSKVSKVYKH